ncbi:MAG: carbon-nitrogen hydrolase family protein [Planctomycetota bacterium]
MKTARVCAVTQSWVKKDRTLNHVLEMLDEAAAQRAEIVCLPEDCAPTDGGEKAKAALDAIAARAKANKMYVAAHLKEREGDNLYSTSTLIGPDGKTIGKYRKSHRLPYEDIALGDDLPVFDTKLGKVGLMIGTDHYWPEIPLILALKGAEMILWSHSPEPVPQGFPMENIMRVRAIDNHITFVCSGYAGDLPYLCSNYPRYTGAPLGRGCVIDRSGIVVADTGIRLGAAVAQLDLKRRKDIYHLTFSEDRKLFHYLVNPDLKPLVHKGTKRKIKVAVASVLLGNQPNPDPKSDFMTTLDDACRQGPDIIVMSEFGFATDTDAAETTFALIAEKARTHKTYIVIGGLRDPERPYSEEKRASWAYLWDRGGEIVGKYRISQYGKSVELPVFKTDFGVIGLILCGDIYSPEICRALALQGAEIILCGSQSWGASGQFNLWMQQARAIDNCVFMATAHFPMSEISQRSYVIDPYGYILAASQYWSNSVCTAEVDLDAGRVWFAPSDKPGHAGQEGYLAGYYPETIPEKRTDFRSVLFAQRRPELYQPIIEKTLSGRAATGATQKKMETPQKD